jgi:signal transduction histidine kinase
MGLVKEIVWGKRDIRSHRDFKYAMLRGEFALIIILIGIFYSVLDYVNGMTEFLPWYGAMIGLTLSSLLMIRLAWYLAADITILLIANAVVYIFADVDHPQGGIYFYFMTASMAGLILASYYHRVAGILFGLLPVALAYYAYLADNHIVPPPSSDPNMIRINFLVNFTMGILSTMFMLRFLYRRNIESETSLWQQNSLLEKTNKELDHFVYSVSHDLRAPLTSILGLTNIYKLTHEPPERDKIIDMISNRAKMLDAFIGEVLDYSRNSRLEPEIKSLAVRELIEEVLAGMKHMPGVEQVDVDIQCPPEFSVFSDRKRLKVVLNNLVANAIHYRDTSKQSKLVIKCYPAHGSWVTNISDNGIGIKAEHINRIFDMFYKANDRVHGSGLGLYIVRETLQRLGGQITVSSEYTVGTTFTIILPISPFQAS